MVELDTHVLEITSLDKLRPERDVREEFEDLDTRGPDVGGWHTAYPGRLEEEMTFSIFNGQVHRILAGHITVNTHGETTAIDYADYAGESPAVVPFPNFSRIFVSQLSRIEIVFAFVSRTLSGTEPFETGV